jgi:Grx4 family monothiol glutaredoxin
MHPRSLVSHTSSPIHCTKQRRQSVKLVKCLHVLRCRPVAALSVSYADSQLKPYVVEGQPTKLPPKSGVYAVYDEDGAVQFVGVSRNVSLSIGSHGKSLGSLVHCVKVGVLENATKEDLTEAWKQWLQEAVNESGSIPPGNHGPEKEKWMGKQRPKVKPEIRLTSGKGLADLTVDLKDLIKMVVDNERIVAFVKGTRTQPQCGFSYQMLTTLNSMNADYQVVNVLDEVYNPGLRDAIKEFSAWPTIPQLYVDSVFIGGSDIVQEMAENGELAKVLAPK